MSIFLRNTSAITLLGGAFYFLSLSEAPGSPPAGDPAVESSNHSLEEPLQEDFWSFRPLTSPPLPDVKNHEWCQTPVDRFILSSIENAELNPAKPLSREKLIRRVTFDLLGLPPTKEETLDFVNDPHKMAFEKVLDRLLASPRYGERWGRYWLDVVRFAESYGFEHDLDNPHAYPYRDFVIEALNADMPYAQFVQWQLAGDELAPEQPLARLATGFLAAGVHNADIAKVRVEQERYDELDDIASTIGTAILGLSIGCARCHDHKYDPISQKNYYQFIAIFERTIRGEVQLPNPFSPGRESITALVASENITPLKRMYNPGPAYFKNTYMLERGDARLKQQEVKPGFLNVLMPVNRNEKRWQSSRDSVQESTYRRSALARWITDSNHGAGSLSARVMVNRIWQHHFGHGLVSTPNDFGSRGAPPTHPALMEWLSNHLIINQGSLKTLHRVILLSATYQQSRPETIFNELDQRLFRGRQAQRLESESIRDAMVALSGRLDLRMYGPGTLDPEQRRRSVYFRIKRSQLIPFMTLFDAPDTLQGTAVRPITTIAPQALAMMNDPQIENWAKHFSNRLSDASGIPAPGPGSMIDDAMIDDAVTNAYRSALGRSPKKEERNDSIHFIKHQYQTYLQSPPSDANRVETDTLVLALDGQNVRYPTPDPESTKFTQWVSFPSSSQSISLTGLLTSFPEKPEFTLPLGQTAVRFGPMRTVLSAPDHQTLNFGTHDFSITMLFRIASNASNDHHILGKDSFSGQDDSYGGYFLQYWNQRLRFGTRTLNSGKKTVNYLDSNRIIAAGTWARITVVRQSSILKMYFNDIPSADAVLREKSPTNVNAMTAFKIGDMDDDLTHAFHGDIAELLIYQHALDEQEIVENHRYLKQKYLEVSPNAFQNAFSDFCQALFCTNEFIYIE